MDDTSPVNVTAVPISGSLTGVYPLVVTLAGEVMRIDPSLIGGGAVLIRSRAEDAPPTSNQVGDAYIVPAGGSAAWGFPDASLVAWSGQMWVLVQPQPGVPLWVADENVQLIYDDGWVATGLAPQSITNNHLVLAPARTVKGNISGSSAGVADVTISALRDEIATTTPATNAIPKAASGGKLDAWVSNASVGTAGKVALGTGAGTACAGDDSRLSDPRSPISHAASHGAGQSDAITPADIGAVASSRQVNAGAGMTGGGALSADLNLAVDLAAASPGGDGGSGTQVARADHKHDQQAWLGARPISVGVVRTGLIGIKRAARIDVTNPGGSLTAVSRSSSATPSNIRGSINAMIEAFGPGGGVLYFPPSTDANPHDNDCYISTAGPIRVLRDNIVFEGARGLEHQTILRSKQGSTQNQYGPILRWGRFTYANTTNGPGRSTWSDGYAATHYDRPFAQTVAYQDYIVCTNDYIDDFAATLVGDKILIRAPQYYMEVPSATIQYKPFQMMLNIVVGKGTDADKMLYLKWPIPWAMTNAPDTYNAAPYSPSRKPTFVRVAEMRSDESPGNDTTPNGDLGLLNPGFYGEVHNLTLASDYYSPLGGPPLGGEISDVVLRLGLPGGLGGAHKVFYFNFAQWTRWRNIYALGGAALAECSMCSTGMSFKDITWELDRNIRPEGPDESHKIIGDPIWSLQENSSDNEIDGLTMIDNAFRIAPRQGVNILKDTGRNNRWKNIDLTIGEDIGYKESGVDKDIRGSGTIITNTIQGSTSDVINDRGTVYTGSQNEERGWVLSGRRMRNVMIRLRRSFGLSISALNIMSGKTSDLQIENLKIACGSATEGLQPTLTVGPGSDGTALRDVSLGRGNIVVSAGATNTVLERIKQFNGTYTDSGTGTIDDNMGGAPEPWRYGDMNSAAN